MVGAKLGVLYGVPRDTKFLCKPRKWAGQRGQKRSCFDLLTRWLHFLGNVGSMPERKNYYCWGDAGSRGRAVVVGQWMESDFLGAPCRILGTHNT